MEPLAAAIGAVICLMLAANAALQQSLGPVGALLAVHLMGTAAALPLALWMKVQRTDTGPVPWPLFTAGLVGVALLLINNRTIPVLGVGLTVALGTLGQLVASASVDHFGLFGLTRRPFRPVQAVGLGVAAVGVLLMTRGGT